MKQRTRQTILDAAAAVLVANPGASLSDVGVAAGVGRTTLHRYFAKRDDLLHAVIAESLERIDEATASLELPEEPVEGDPAVALRYLRSLVEVLVPIGDRCHLLWLSTEAYDDADLAASYQRQLDGLNQLTEWLKQAGAVAPDVPTAWFVTALDALLYAAWSSIQGGSVAPLDAPQLVVRSLFGQLAPIEGRTPVALAGVR